MYSIYQACEALQMESAWNAGADMTPDIFFLRTRSRLSCSSFMPASYLEPECPSAEDGKQVYPITKTMAILLPIGAALTFTFDVC